MIAAAALAFMLMQSTPPAVSGTGTPDQIAISTTQQQLERAAKQRPNDPDAQFQLGVFFDSRKAHTEAVAAFRKVIALRPTDARAWDYLALHLEALGQVDEAEAAYRKGEAVNTGRFSDAYLDYNYGRLLAKRNRLADSLAHFDRALSAAPPTRAIHYERARVLLRLGRLPEARSDAEKALALADPGRYILDLQAYNLLVQIYTRLGERELATKFAELAKTADIPLQARDRGVAGAGEMTEMPKGIPEDIEAAKRLISEGKPQEAVPLLRKALSIDPQDADAHLLLGTALALVPSRTEAISELTKAVRLRPSFAPAYLTLATALARFGDFDKARENYEKALEIDPKLTEARVRLAMVLAAGGQLDAAIGQLSRAIAAQGESPEAGLSLYLRGKAYAQRNEITKAAEDLEHAVRVQPQNPKALLELGLIRSQLGDQPGALASLEKVAQLAPKDPGVQFELGSQYLRNGEPGKAVQPLREAFTLRPGDRAAAYALAKALQGSGAATEAKSILDQLVHEIQAQTANDPDLARSGALNNEGVALEREGNYSEALERYRAALAISPGQIEFRRNLALVLCRLDRWEEAIPELRSILKELPGDPDTTKALYIALEHVPQSKP